MSRKRLLSSFVLVPGLLLCLAASSARATTGTVDVYPLPACFTPSTTWTLTANGINVPVRAYQPHAPTTQYYYAHVGISGGWVTFVADPHTSFSSWSVSPKNYGISPSTNSYKLSFSIQHSRYIEINVDTRATLCLMVDDSEVNPPSPAGPYNVVTGGYGAATNGTTMATSAIQKAINDAHTNAAGGTVYFPAGIYLSKALTLKANVNLYFAPGSCLLADTTTNDWPHPNGSNRFIDASGASNSEIFGRGTIACRGCTLNDQVAPNSGNANHLFQICPVYVANVNNFTVDGIILNESTAWTLAIRENSGNVNVSNVKVFNPIDWQWNDGIDTAAGTNVTVTHCYVRTCDDAYCVKAINYPTHEVTYSDVVAYTGNGSGVKCGSEAEFDAYNVTFTNFNIISAHRGFSIERWKGPGYWHDIHFIDGRVEDQTGSTGSEKVQGSYYCCPLRLEDADISDPNFTPGSNAVAYVEATRVAFDTSGPNPSYIWGYNNNNCMISNVNFTLVSITNSEIGGWSWGTLTNKGGTANITWNTNPSQQTYEAETLAYTTSGCAATNVSDTNFSGNGAVKVSSTAVNQWVQFTLTNVPPGTYEHVQIIYRSYSDHGQYQASIGGSNLGPIQDQYGDGTYGLTNDVGRKTFYATGNHTLRLTVTGKNASSSGYTLNVDKIVLLP